MTQDTIGQRIKFLIDSQKMSVRKFAQLMDVSEATVRNYFDRGTKPSSDFFEKLHHNFSLFNLTWLITGEGEPFTIPPTENEQSTTNAKFFLHSPVVGKNSGIANQQQTSATSAELATAYALIEQLKSQLQDKERIIKLLERNSPPT